MIYYILFLLIAFLSLLEVFVGIKNKVIPFFFILATLIIVSGTRWNTGTDFLHYQRLFDLIVVDGNADGVERSFSLVSMFFMVFKYVLLFLASLSIILKYISIKHFKYPITIFMLYYSFLFLSFDMGRMRQGVALAFCFIALLFVFKKNLPLFLLFVILGFLFHKTAILFILVYPLYHIRFKKKTLVIAVAISFVAMLFHIDVYLFQLVTNLPLLSNYADYFSVDSQFAGFSFSISNLRRIALIIVFYLFVPLKNSRNRLFFNMFAFGTIIFYFFKDFPVVSERASIYFCFTEIFLIPQVIYYFAKRKMVKPMVISFVLIFAYCLAYVYLTSSINNDDYFNKPYIPYSSWLGGDADILDFILLLSLTAIPICLVFYLSDVFKVKKRIVRKAAHG